MPAPLVVGFVLVVAASYTCAATLGFGANVIAVALGAHLLPVEVLLPAILPTSLLLSGTLALRDRRQIAWRTLLRDVLPWCALGFPLGAYLFHAADPGMLRTLLGGLVAFLGALELLRGWMGPYAEQIPLPAPVAALFLTAGGFVQGLFASGGPLIVYVLARRLKERGAFRATLCALWVLLNSVLLGSYAVDGRFDSQTLELTAWAVLPLLVGLGLGQQLHTRLPERAFRRAVHFVLLSSGIVLLARGLLR